MTFQRTLGTCVLLLACATAVRATDPWEADPEDDGPGTRTYLPAGTTQAGRDLQGGPGTPDQDWVHIWTLPHRSYVARVSGGPLWSGPAGPDGAKLERLNESSAVLATGTNNGAPSLRGLSLPFAGGAAPAAGYLRVTGPATVAQGAEPYLLELHDTTYTLPRWNNSGSQVTVVVVQNTTADTLGGWIVFFDGSGAVLHTALLEIDPNGLLVLNTSTVPALAGQSGSARIVQFGGVGAVAGKAVALEPTTGFTFDTALVPVMP